MLNYSGRGFFFSCLFPQQKMQFSLLLFYFGGTVNPHESFPWLHHSLSLICMKPMYVYVLLENGYSLTKYFFTEIMQIVDLILCYLTWLNQKQKCKNIVEQLPSNWILCASFLFLVLFVELFQSLCIN